ncbi:hypothetical protein ACFWWM_17350 [Streptomyces sp. NPDC058682]|uniref:hypothetical protein n=1 Tax=Streptomyces sp. NPDC058682 TaxID=3346596 RepID=UPI00365EB4A5
MPDAGGKGRAAIDALLGMAPEYVPEALPRRDPRAAQQHAVPPVSPRSVAASW